MIISAILPVIVVGVLALLIIGLSVWMAYRAHTVVRDAITRGAQRLLPITLVIAFSVPPHLSARLSSVFECEHFATGDNEYRYYVRADYRVECTLDDPVYWQASKLAVALIVIYLCGVPLFFAVLLNHSLHSLRKHQHTAFTAATEFLHSECGSRPAFLQPQPPTARSLPKLWCV